MKSTIKSAFAITAVALMIMVAIVPMVGVFTSDNTAAVEEANPYIADVSVEIYTELSDDLSGLLFKGNALPESLDPTEWVNTGTGTWYNVNENSEDYAEILTFGKAGFSTDDTVAYLRAYKPYSLPALQMTFVNLQNDDGNGNQLWVGFRVYKSGVEISQTGAHTTGELKQWFGTTRVGSYFPYGVQSIMLEEIAEVDAAGINISEVGLLGTYTVDIYGGTAAARTLIGTEYVTCVTDKTVKVQGTVVDSNGTATNLIGAEVTYDVTDADGNVTRDQKAKVVTSTVAADNNKYTIYAAPGSIIDIKNVALTGYTFANKTYSTATIGYDAVVIPAFTATEKTATVTLRSAVLNDENAAPVAGSTISASWYYWSLDTGTDDEYTITTTKPTTVATGGDVTVLTKTDDTGVASVSYTVPKDKSGTAIENAGLYVKAGNVSPFTVTAGQTFVLDTPRQAIPIAGANLHIQNTGVIGNYTFAANEYTAVITVKDGNATPANATPIKGATLQATVYYSDKAANANPGVTIATNDNVPNTDVTTKATATPYGTSGIDGTVRVAFTLPVFVQTPTTYKYAYVLVSEKDKVDPFTFKTKTSISTSTTLNINDQINGYAGTKVIALGENGSAIDTQPTATINAEETVQTITVTVTKASTLTIGKVISVSIKNSGFDTTKTIAANVAWADDTTATVDFKMLTTTAPSFTLSCAGYNFTNNGSRVATGAVAFATTVTPMTPAEFGLVVVPSTVGTFTATGVTGDKAVTTFEFALNVDTSATSYKVTTLGANPTLTIHGTFVDEVVEVSAVSGTKVYEFDPTGAAAPVVMASVSFVAYMVELAVDTVVPGLSFAIVSNNKIVGMFTTDEYGTATVEIDNTLNPANLIYVTNGLSFTAAATVAPYAGYYGIDVAAMFPEEENGCVLTFADASGHATWSFGAELIVDEIPVGSIISLSADEIYYNDVTGDQVSANATLTQKMTFKGWFVNGTLYSKDANTSFVVLDDASIVAAYEASEIVDNTPAAEKQPGIDSTTLIIGIVAVVIALIAVAFAVISVKKKEQ